MLKRTNAGGRTKRANEISIVYGHQHGGSDITCKPPIQLGPDGDRGRMSLEDSVWFLGPFSAFKLFEPSFVPVTMSLHLKLEVF